jgi:hypothetical protein
MPIFLLCDVASHVLDMCFSCCGRKDNTIILTNGQLAISTTGEARGWQHHIGEKLA